MSAWSLGDKKSAIKGRERALSTESSVPDSTDLNDYENGDEEDPAHGPADYNMKVLAELSIGDQAEVVNPFEPAHVPLNHRSQSWVRRIATKPWAVVLATFTALSIVFYFAFPNTIVLSNPLWVLTFDFAIKVLAAILSAFLERAIIRILKMIITDWIRPPCLQRLRYSIFILFLQISWPLILSVSTEKVQFYINTILLSLQLFNTFWIVKELLFDTISARRNQDLFSHRIAMLYYHGRILQRLCCRTSTELSAESSREVHNKFLYQKRSLLSPFLLPLREDSSGGVVFTANINGGTVFVSSVVQPDLTRYMFNNLQPPDMEGTTFDGWVKFFPDRPRAQYVYKEFFGESPKPHQSITFRQFRISVDRFVQRRQRLTSWMETRDNLTDLIHRIVSGVYSLIMVFVTASLFGLNLTVVLSTLTSLMLSVAFAIGSTISKMTESIIYIFVYKPFDVGDRVEIEGDQFIIHRINLLTTMMYNTENRLCIVANQLLASKKLYNLRKSETATVVIKFQIPDGMDKNIAGLQRSIANFFKANDDVWFPIFSLYATDIAGPNSMALTAKIRSGWQDLELSSRTRSKLIEFIRLTLRNELPHEDIEKLIQGDTSI